MSPGSHAYLAKPVCEKTRAQKLSAGRCWHHGCHKPVRPGRSDCNTCQSRKAFGPFLKEARAILDQVETLQRLEREETEQLKAEHQEGPF